MFIFNRPLSTSIHFNRDKRIQVERAISSYSTSITSQDNSLKSSHVTAKQVPSKSLNKPNYQIRIRYLSINNKQTSNNHVFNSYPIQYSGCNKNQKNFICKDQRRVPKFVAQRNSVKNRQNTSTSDRKYISEVVPIPELPLSNLSSVLHRSQISPVMIQNHKKQPENPENQLQISFRKDCNIFIRNKSQPGIFLCDFKIVRFLRERNLGQQFLAINRETCFLIIIRRIKKQELKAKDRSQLLLQQIKQSKTSDNPSLRKIYGFFNDQKYFYSVLQCTQQITLNQKIESRFKVDESSILQLVIIINDGLLMLHKKGKYHGQLKASNILCNYGEIKMIGIQGISSDRVKKRKSASKQFDMWCLGIILYELLVGRMFSHKNQEDLQLIRKPNQKIRSLSALKNKSDEIKHLLVILLNPCQKQRISSEQFANLPFIKLIKEVQRQEFQ